MPAAATDLRAEWERLQASGVELAAALDAAAGQLDREELLPASRLAESLQDFRRRLESFRIQVDPHCPAEQAAAEDRIRFESFESALWRAAEADRVQSQLDRVLTLQHVDDPEYAPLSACRDDALRILAARHATTPQAASEWRDFVAGTHPLNALLTQLTGSAELSDDAWAELGERLATAYGRSLATAVARGRILIGDEPAATPVATVADRLPVTIAEESEVNAATLPAAGGQASVSSEHSQPALTLNEAALSVVTLPQVIAPNAATRFEVDIESPVDPDLHAPETAEGASFLDADCPFNPLSPSSSLTLALASSRDQLPPTTADTKVEVIPVASSFAAKLAEPASSIFDDDAERRSTPRRDLELQLAAAEITPSHDAATEPLRTVNEAVPPPPVPARPIWETFPLRDRSAAPEAVVEETLNSLPETTIFEVERVATGRMQVSIEDLAGSAAAADGAQRIDLMSQLQIELLRSGRYALAYQLTRCLEAYRKDSSAALPLWLVRALTLGEHVVFPKGNVAQMLQEDFAEFRRELLYRGDREWGEGLGFFLRAAAIRPAVLAPASRGAAMLRAVGIHENLCHLYNYCSRIIRFADQDQGNVLQLLRPNEYDEPRRQAQQQLLLEIEAWSQTSPPAESPEIELLVQQLLEPIVANQPTAVGWVRQEVARLSGEIQVDREGHTARPRYMPARLKLIGDDSRRHLREALQFANRWLALQGPLPMAIIDAFVPPALQELRNSILDRHESAIVELLACDQAEESQLISAGIAACRRAMRNVHDLFDPRIAPPSEEPDPRHILNGILLKIPHISLNARWEPELELPALETELLEFLSQPEPTWQDVLDMHSEMHDHTATERLLELDVWGSAANREELREKRRKQIVECRSELERESRELLNTLSELAKAGLIDLQDQAGLENRLERLSKGIDKVLTFSQVEAQFAQIRNVLQRIRPMPTVLGKSESASPLTGALGMSGMRKASRLNGAAHASPANELAQRDSVWVMDFN